MQTNFSGPTTGLALALLCLLGMMSVASSQDRVREVNPVQLLERQSGSGSFAIEGGPGPGLVEAQKQCCAVGGVCEKVPNNTTSCGSFATARTCDDDGSNCKDHGTPDFPED